MDIYRPEPGADSSPGTSVADVAAQLSDKRRQASGEAASEPAREPASKKRPEPQTLRQAVERRADAVAYDKTDVLERIKHDDEIDKPDLNLLDPDGKRRASKNPRAGDTLRGNSEVLDQWRALEAEVYRTRVQQREAELAALDGRKPVEVLQSVIDADRARQQAAPGGQQPQPEQVEQPIDPEIARARSEAAAHTARLAETLTAAAAYAQSNRQVATETAKQSFSALATAFPECLTTEGERKLALQNPERYRQFIEGVEHTKRVVAVAQDADRRAAAAQGAQAQLFQQEFQKYAEAQDAEFKRLVPEFADKTKANEITAAAHEHLEAAGFSTAELSRAWLTNPLMRDAKVQKFIWDAASTKRENAALKARLAEYENARDNMTKHLASNPVPPVQRPGSLGMRDAANGNGDAVAAASARLARNPRGQKGLAAAAELLSARRAARRAG